MSLSDALRARIDAVMLPGERIISVREAVRGTYVFKTTSDRDIGFFSREYPKTTVPEIMAEYGTA
jgi:hypothetical protein